MRKRLRRRLKKNKATAEMLVTIIDDCNKVLAFLQAGAVKSPRVIATTLYLCVYKCAHVWFRRWSENNLPAPSKTEPQNHTGIMVVLINVATRLQNAEALRSLVAAQREAEKDTKGWDRLLPTAQ